MFLIAGVQPRTRKGSKTDQICPQCGLAQVYERRLDHYFSLFFIPLVRVTKGENTLWCERCQQLLATRMRPSATANDPPLGSQVCQGCGKDLDPEFRYCPTCGKAAD